MLTIAIAVIIAIIAFSFVLVACLCLISGAISERERIAELEAIEMASGLILCPHCGSPEHAPALDDKHTAVRKCNSCELFFQHSAY